MREAVGDLGGDPDKVNPLAPAEMVIDHSVIVDVFGNAGAFERNVDIEYDRNGERYQFLRWGQGAFDDFKVVPAGHRHRAPGQHRVPGPHRDGARRSRLPRHLRGHRQPHHDGQRPRRAGLGRRRYRGRGRHARPAGLDAHPPRRRLQADRRDQARRHRHRRGAHRHRHAAQARRGRQVRRVLRRRRRRGAAGQPRHAGQHEPRIRLHRSDFPDRRGDRRLPAADRPHRGAARAGRGLRQGAGHVARPGSASPSSPSTSNSTSATWCRPSPDRSARRTASCCRSPRSRSARTSTTTSKRTTRRRRPSSTRPSTSPSRPAIRSRCPSPTTAQSTSVPRRPTAPHGRPSKPVTVHSDEQGEFVLDHGAVVVAAITSCTNTSNPSVMLGAALLARNAVEKGLTSKPWVKTSMAPGFAGRQRLLRQGRRLAVPGEAGLLPGRLRLHHLHRQHRPAAGRHLARPSTTTTSR